MKAKTFTVIAAVITTMSACMEQTPTIPNAVSASMFQTMQTGPYISFSGGYYDGAAAGQTTKVVVTPDDRVQCTFEMASVLAGDGPPTLDAYDTTIAGIYAAFQRNLSPPRNVEDDFAPNFIVEISGTGQGFDDFEQQRVRFALVAGMPEFWALTDVFNANLHPCWAFG